MDQDFSYESIDYMNFINRHGMSALEPAFTSKLKKELKKSGFLSKSVKSHPSSVIVAEDVP